MGKRLRFSKRTAWPLHPNPLTDKLLEKKRLGRNVIDLTVSNPTACDFRFYGPKLLEPLAEAENLSYSPDPKGISAARKAVCAYYKSHDADVVPEQIFLTSGTSEAYSFLFSLLADPGDTVLAPKPSYPLLDYLADLNDLKLLEYRFRYDGQWRLDETTLEKREKAKALIVIHPNNPTGNFIRPGEREALNRFCREGQCALIADEVFLDYAHSGSEKVFSFAANEEVLTFTLSGVSKILGLPQMKLSWIVVSGPEEARRTAVERLEIIADTFLSVGAPPQRALAGWLKRQPEIGGEILARVLVNKAHLIEELSGSAALPLSSMAGWCAVLRIPYEDEEKAVLDLLEQKDVLVHPGYFFDFEVGSHLVISLLPPPGIFKEGVSRLLNFIKS